MAEEILSPTSYLNTWEIRNRKTGEQFTDLLKRITIELSKLPKDYGGQPEWPWLQYFKCSTRKELEMLVKSHPEVGKAAAVLEELSWSERHRMLAEAREKERRDIQAMIEDGRKEGRKEMALETARRMKEAGFSQEQISALTGLPPD
jgi:predicted transposase/invertase (TIGR01784 family)